VQIHILKEANAKKSKSGEPVCKTTGCEDECSRRLWKGGSGLSGGGTLEVELLPYRRGRSSLESRRLRKEVLEQPDNPCLLLRAKAPTRLPGLFILDFHLRDYPKSRQPSHSWYCLCGYGGVRKRPTSSTFKISEPDSITIIGKSYDAYGPI
jgi:hypothetical protein